MNEVWAVFLLGLTTGGLACMAIQGGLLASSLAHQIEKELEPIPGRKPKIKGFRPSLGLPILLFLGAKLGVYTLLGFGLGALGSVFQLTLTLQALLQILIGLFILGNALRMFEVHPFFRFFSFEPPAPLTRFIRRQAKNQTSWLTPLYLGALTIFIPCGVTQGVMATAVATGNPWQGALLLFVFTVGTSPLFFLLSYFTTRLGVKLEKYFVRGVALVLLILGFLAVDTGATLLGSPYSFNRLIQTVLSSNSLVIAPATGSAQEISIKATGWGYEPRTIHAAAQQPIKLHLLTQDTYSCARAFTIPELNLTKLLAKTDDQLVEIPPQPLGKILNFSCSMGMYTGEIIFDQ